MPSKMTMQFDYRQLALERHPDKHPNGKERAAESFQQLQSAKNLMEQWFKQNKFHTGWESDAYLASKADKKTA